MDAEFATLDLRIAEQIHQEALNGHGRLGPATKAYIALVRHYAEKLGHSEARRRLDRTSAKVVEWCPRCAFELSVASASY